MHRKPTETVNGNGQVFINPATNPPAHREKKNIAHKMQEMSQRVPGEGGQAIAEAAMLVMGLMQTMELLMEDVASRRRLASASPDELSNSGYGRDDYYVRAEFEL
jgi:hypothetical protein